jgi:histidinol dehydrogenase
MARRLNAADASFAQDFQKLLFAKREEEEDVAAIVRGIVADIRKRGDAALVELTNRFDRANVTKDTLKLSAGEIDIALGKVSKDQLAAIETAAARIENYHLRQIPEDAHFTDDTGAQLGWRWTSVDSAGLYVPGGTAAYPSPVLMNTIPAKWRAWRAS